MKLKVSIMTPYKVIWQEGTTGLPYKPSLTLTLGVTLLPTVTLVCVDVNLENTGLRATLSASIPWQPVSEQQLAGPCKEGTYGSSD